MTRALAIAGIGFLLSFAGPAGVVAGALALRCPRGFVAISWVCMLVTSAVLR